MEVKNINRVDTGRGNKDASAGFPSHLVEPKIKLTPEWCLSFLKGMNTGNNQMTIFRNNTEKYKQWRDYARGDQEIDQYKEMLTSSNKKNRGRKNQSWRNLDYEIMPIAPKFVRILEGMIMKQPRIVKTKGIDNESLDAERTYESKLSEFVFNRDWLSKIQGAGFNANSPIAQGDPEPMTMGEIPLYKDIYYKDRNALELKDVIDTTLEVNKMDEQGRRDCVIDYIEVGVAGTKVFVDTNGFLKIRRTIPERIISNVCRKDDFGDISWVGEYQEMTIQELKQEAGNQFTEEEYRRIAEESNNKSYGSASNFIPTFTEEDVISYPYDNEKITVLDGEWFSVDSRTSKVGKNKAGNPTFERVKNNFLPNGVSDDMYKEQSKGEKYLMRRNLKNVYRGKWVVNTGFIYNYGLQTDMIRMGSSLEDVKLSYTFHTSQYSSVIRNIIPILDQIQINWLQFQNHNARSRPSGLSIEMGALENLQLGKGGEKMTPKEALRLYFDTGILVWRRKEWGGASNQWKPIEELANAPSAGAQQSLTNIITMIDMLRNILGINEVSDASTPNPEIGKFVTESAMVATQSAINYLYFGDKKIYEGTAEKVALLLPSLIKKGKSKAFIGALGLSSYNFFKNNIDLTRYEFSTKIEVGYSDEQRAIVQKYMQIDITNGTIGSDDAIKIEGEENPHKQASMLRQAKIETQKRESEVSQQNAQLEVEKNTASAQASSAAEVEKETQLSELRNAEAVIKSDLTIKEQNNKLKGDIILRKLDAGIKLTEQDDEQVTDILKEKIKQETALEVAEINAETAEKVSKEKPKAEAA